MMCQRLGRESIRDNRTWELCDAYAVPTRDGAPAPDRSQPQPRKRRTLLCITTTLSYLAEFYFNSNKIYSNVTIHNTDVVVVSVTITALISDRLSKPVQFN
ncbi:hypothetical protein B5X24_HaOG205459 [Helicoverpa armigera]|nr:hypothetical protein B5X24_HaOG205459 [Helicoverpa armigera]